VNVTVVSVAVAEPVRSTHKSLACRVPWSMKNCAELNVPGSSFIVDDPDEFPFLVGDVERNSGGAEIE
jgi:hypothetical protein